MSEYYMTHTGAELDEAISKVKNGYILPTEVINIVTNKVSNMDITKGKTLNVDVPITHFATGTVSNVTSGGKLSVTGIKDSVTGEAFTPKGLICFICPTSTANFQSSANNSAIVAFYKDSNVNDGAGIAAFSPAYTVRINPGVGTGTTYITISGNSFSYKALSGSMYGLMAGNRWRWIAWA